MPTSPKPTPKQLLRAKEYYDKLKPNVDGVLSLPQQLKDKEARLKINPKLWHPTKYRKTGFSSTLSSRHTTRMEHMVKNITLEQFNTKIRDDCKLTKDYNQGLEQAEKFILIVEEILAIPDEEIIKRIFKDSTPTNGYEEYIGYQWYAYFLYYMPDEEKHKEALLGRAIVTIEKFKEKEKTWTVRFQNTQVKYSTDYRGTFKIYPKIGGGSNSIVFSFESDIVGRRLHIKINFSELNQPIMLGLHSTYENHVPQNGTVLFQLAKTPKETFVEGLETGLFSFQKNREEFKKIPVQIRDFFRFKAENYMRVFKGIETLEGLEKRMNAESHKLFKKSGFLEKERPVVYARTPSSDEKDKNKNRDEKTMVEIVGQLKADFKAFDFIINGPDENFNEVEIPIPEKTLASIKSSRFFILFLEDVTRMSYSFLQFAWAIEHCKAVALVCTEKNVSPLILSLDDLMDKNKMFTLITYENSLKEDRVKISKKLNRFMIYNSPKLD